MNIDKLVEFHKRYLENYSGGGFQMMGILFVPDPDGGEPGPMPFIGDDSRVLGEMLRRAARDTRAVAVVVMSEAWVASVPAGTDASMLQRGFATNHPERREKLVLTVEVRGAGSEMWWADVQRDGGKLAWEKLPGTGSGNFVGILQTEN